MRKRIFSIFFTLLAAFLLAISAAATDYDGYIVQLRPSEISLFSADRVTLPEGMAEIYTPEGLYTVNDLELLSLLEDADLLVSVEPDYYMELYGKPDDTYYVNGQQWSLDMVGMDYAWANNITGSGVRIGVIDTGVYRAHQDLNGANISDGTYYIDKKTVSDDVSDNYLSGHGTFVTGVIAAVTNNGTGIAGMAPDAEIVPLKVVDASGCKLSVIIKALYEAVDTYHCQIVNMSLGTTVKSSDLEDAVNYAASQGVILVAAAGNNGNATLSYPAAFDNVIGVGMVDSERVVSTNSQKNESVFVVAPGERVYGLSNSGNYILWTGTSFAAPMVAATAALALSVDPELTLDQFKELLMETSLDLGKKGYDTSYGYGLLQVDALLKKLAIRVERNGLPENTTVQVVVAAYGSTGQQLDLTVTQATTDEAGTLSVKVSFAPPDDTSYLKIMVLDSGWAPLCAVKYIQQ